MTYLLFFEDLPNLSSLLATISKHFEVPDLIIFIEIKLLFHLYFTVLTQPY